MFFETVIFILVVLVLVIILQLKKNLTEKLEFLYMRIEQLSGQLAKKEIATTEKPVEENIVPETEEPFVPYVQKDSLIPENSIIPAQEPSIKPEWENTIITGPEQGTEQADKIEQQEMAASNAIKRSSFRERNPDLEKFIGENLFNKIGIVILVLGMGFFLKYAIDKDWINEIGRVSIGFICGGVLIGLAHRLRKLFVTFSSVLVGGGVAILYFTVTIAFHQYQLFNQTLAFILTIIITGFTVLLSISYDRKELALFAILGGFGAPFMVSTGEGNHIVLFTYILILNIGMLVLAYYKKWPAINVVCYIFTLILFGGWLSTKVLITDNKTPPYTAALIFASLFYLVFLAMNIINNIKEKTKFNALEIGILLSNTFLYYSAGMLILNHIDDGNYRGLFTALLGLVNLAFAYGLYKNEKIDRNLIYLLIGLVLTFISLAAPVQLKGNHITLFWAAESVLLLWLSQKSGITLIRQSSVIVLVLMALSLMMDWQQIYWSNLYYTVPNTLPPILNRGFITGLVAVAGIVLYYRLLKNEIKSVLFTEVKASRTILAIAAILAGYFVMIFELNHQAYIYFPQIRILALGCYSYLFIIVLLIAIRNADTAEFKFSVGAIAAVALFCYVLLFNSETIFLRNSYLEKDGILNNYLFHYLLVVLIGFTIYFLYKNEKQLKSATGLIVLQWFTSFIILYVASAELDHLVVMAQYSKGKTISDIVNGTHKTGFAILWGCFAFLCIYIGMKWKSKNVRIISITILAITLLKLFLFDLRGLSEGGKIAAFISLGILLLVISFMYQRLKRLLLTNDKITDVKTTNTKQE